MAGTATSNIRSAFVAETTPGTIPTSPAFTTSHALLRMKAVPVTIEGRSQVSGGARMGHGVSGIDVTGELSATPLVYGVYDTLIATLLQGAWASNVLKDGKATATVAVEYRVPAGAGGTNTFLRFRGVEAVGGTLMLQAREAAMLSMNLIGRGSEDAATAALSGATYTDPTEFDALSSGDDVGAITFGSYTLDCMESAEIAFTYEGRDPQPKIASNDLCGVTRGDFLPVITARVYVESNFAAIYNAARERHAAFAVTIQLGSVTGEKYTLEFPACHFGSTEIDLSGANAMQTVIINPGYSAADACVLKMTRAVA
ncbi:MAG: hypothetical protein E6R03_02750 [Hyphomicrobiaceae bacterium]|nr:MAG: hypothetical protein E6R03_02750 [Hyphomicrobiaceae bacterium]